MITTTTGYTVTDPDALRLWRALWRQLEARPVPPPALAAQARSGSMPT